MTVCKYWLAGNCKFGNKCRYEHPSSDTSTIRHQNTSSSTDHRHPHHSQQQQQSSHKSTTTPNTDAPDGFDDSLPVYLLSGYADAWSGDISPEELRLQFLSMLYQQLQQIPLNQSQQQQQMMMPSAELISWQQSLFQKYQSYIDARQQMYRQQQQQQGRNSGHSHGNGMMSGVTVTAPFPSSINQMSNAPSSNAFQTSRTFHTPITTANAFPTVNAFNTPVTTKTLLTLVTLPQAVLFRSHPFHNQRTTCILFSNHFIGQKMTAEISQLNIGKKDNKKKTIVLGTAAVLIILGVVFGVLFGVGVLPGGGKGKGTQGSGTGVSGTTGGASSPPVGKGASPLGGGAPVDLTKKTLNTHPEIPLALNNQNATQVNRSSKDPKTGLSIIQEQDNEGSLHSSLTSTNTFVLKGHQEQQVVLRGQKAQEQQQQPIVSQVGGVGGSQSPKQQQKQQANEQPVPPQTKQEQVVAPQNMQEQVVAPQIKQEQTVPLIHQAPEAPKPNSSAVPSAPAAAEDPISKLKPSTAQEPQIELSDTELTLKAGALTFLSNRHNHPFLNPTIPLDMLIADATVTIKTGKNTQSTGQKVTLYLYPDVSQPYYLNKKGIAKWNNNFYSVLVNDFGSETEEAVISQVGNEINFDERKKTFFTSASYKQERLNDATQSEAYKQEILSNYEQKVSIDHQIVKNLNASNVHRISNALNNLYASVIKERSLMRILDALSHGAVKQDNDDELLSLYVFRFHNK